MARSSLIAEEPAKEAGVLVAAPPAAMLLMPALACRQLLLPYSSCTHSASGGDSDHPNHTQRGGIW